LDLEVKHFLHFVDRIPGMNACCRDTVKHLLEMGVIQVSTAFEHALAEQGGHRVVSQDRGDLYRAGAYSDAKLSSVRTSGRGCCYSAPVSNIYNKTGTLRVQVYERKQDRFYYFAIPRRAYIDVPKSSNIEIPFELDGTPRRTPKRAVYVNWWRYEVPSWQEMAQK
jgi:hypothetical protein